LIEGNFGHHWFVFIGLYVHRNPAEAIRNTNAAADAVLPSIAPFTLKEKKKLAGLRTSRELETRAAKLQLQFNGNTIQSTRNPTVSLS
jgi:hypothetical protein